MIKLSESAYKIEGQPMFKILERVQELEREGKHIIHFEIGDPDLNTPKYIIDAAYSSMLNGETHYTNSMGLYDFRMAVTKATLSSRKFLPTIDQVLVTPGANIIIYLAVKCLVNTGEDVIIPDPGFPTYNSVLKFCDVNPIRVPLREENKFRMNPDDIRKAITPKTRLIIINSPNNPTGAVMTPEEIDQVYDIAEENDIFILSDEVYSRMMYEGKFHSPSANDHCKRRTIVMNGFSKVFAMTGWRLGVAIGPEHIIEKMGLLVQTLVSCTPPFIQRAGISAIEGDQTEVWNMMNTYKERRDIIVDGLNSIRGISCVKSNGAFYVFPNITKTGMTSGQFAKYLLDDDGVAVVPGTNFGEYGEGYIRLTYATNIENIKIGLERIRKSVEKL